MSNIDATSINTIRALAADVTREANSGHPGMCCAKLWMRLRHIDI